MIQLLVLVLILVQVLDSGLEYKRGLSIDTNFEGFIYISDSSSIMLY